MEPISEPVVFFLVVMTLILVMPMLSERVRLPGIVGVIIGGMLIGPNGFNLLPANDRMQFLSTIGLVYLMFSAGLEVDFHQFMRVKNKSLVFGILTFSIPLGMGIGLGLLIHLSWLGSVLLGSAFASHTLLAFPVLTKLGVTRNDAVAVTAGATILTDIGAFFILAIVLGAKDGHLEATYFIKMIFLLIVFTITILFLLPKLGKWFFKRFSGSMVDFQFVIVLIFIAAFGAKLIGVHEVVGAFLVGLGISATLPRHSPVTNHVLFMGESFLIPLFLLYSGMITDPMTLVHNPQSILLAFGILLVAYISKLLASFIAAKIYGYSKAEFWTMYGLSHAQAAVTIPTLVIGMSLNLFNAEIYNAAMVMILFTSISSPLIVQKFAAGLGKRSMAIEEIPLFRRILIPIADPPKQESLLSLGAFLAKSCHGEIVALDVVIDRDQQDKNLLLQKELLEKIPDVLDDSELRYELIVRLADSFARGILQVSREKESSLILMGWRGKKSIQQNILGSVLDEVIWGSNTPVMIAKLAYPLDGMERILFLIPEGSIDQGALRRILEVNLTMAQELNVPCEILAHKNYLGMITDILIKNRRNINVGVKEMIGSLRPRDLETREKSDLIVVPGFGSRKRFTANLGNLPEQLAESFTGNLVILHFDR